MRIRQAWVGFCYYVMRGCGSAGGGTCKSQLQIFAIVRLCGSDRSDVVDAFWSRFLHAVNVDIPDKIKPRFHNALITVHVHAIGFLSVNVLDATLPNNAIAQVVFAFGVTATLAIPLIVY